MNKLLLFALLMLAPLLSDAQGLIGVGADGKTQTRPTASTGAGFFVVGSKLYDPKGVPAVLRGTNLSHYDQNHTGLDLAGMNAARIALVFTKPQASNYAIVQNQLLAKKIVPIVGSWAGTCKSDAATLSTIVDAWVAQASTWTLLNTKGIVNIANEWGPANSVVWRDSYILAVARMRAAGYTGTLMIDSGGCGQDAQDVVKYGAAVLASDPQKNILFDVHVYGTFHYPKATAAWMQDYDTALKALQASGLAIMVGEFGPGKNVGPSPTTLPPETIIARAEAAGFAGWMSWAWDDNDLGACMSDEHWFAMVKRCGQYSVPTDLTAFGTLVVPFYRQLGTHQANVSF